jgi:formiminotetrahydrofolate cyclodeaminase
MMDNAKYTDIQISEFIEQLSSKAPVPGGGGASALIGAIGVSLCSMVANLTLGKKKYIEYQTDIEIMLLRTSKSIEKLLSLIQKDAEAFEPLSIAYSIPKNEPNRDDILENALVTACSVPMDILREVASILDIIEQLFVKGSKLAISDVGVAASVCRCAMESSVMNVYINTKLMKNRDYALKINEEARDILLNGVVRCDHIYKKIIKELDQ